MRKSKRFLPWLATIFLVLALMPFSAVGATNGTAVWIEVPSEVAHCNNFVARVNIDDVVNLDSYQFKLQYNPAVIEVLGAEGGGEGVTNGVVGGTSVPVAMWMFSPMGTPGTIFILGNVSGVLGASGSGYLCEIHFHALGEPDDVSALDFDATERKLFDTSGTGTQIPATWTGASVTVTGFDADFYADSGLVGHPQEGIAGVTSFQFTDLTTGGTPPYTNWAWDFGDGLGTSSAPNPSYTYPNPGTYTVALTVTDSTPDTSTDTKINYITVYPPLHADFLADSGIVGHPLEGIAGVTSFAFTDETSGGLPPYNNWIWNFGDGIGTSTLENPSYTYPFAGTYTVSLTVSDSLPGASTDTETKVNYITVSDPVVADFSADSGIPGHPHEGYAGVTSFAFTDESYDGVPPYTNWAWDFGDGMGTSTLENPSYVYPFAGIYTVSLTVTDSASGTATDIEINYITVYGTFDADFVADSGIVGHEQEGFAGETNFAFTDLTTGGILPYTNWAWNFGDGLGTSALEDPTYMYPNPGTYTVVLTVTDSLPGTNTETKIDYITVYGPLDADFVADSGIVGHEQEGIAGVTSFGFTDETSGGLPPYSNWNWDFGDGLGTSTLENPSYIYPFAGTYTVSLTVDDSLMDSDTDTKVDYITVYDPVVADFLADSGIPGHPQEGYAATTSFQFTDESTDGMPPYTNWAWDFGDTVGTSTLENPTYIYPAPGTYTVILTVTDSASGTDTETKIDYITVYNAFDADFSADSGIVGHELEGTAGETEFQFIDLTTGGETPYTAWAWDFGDTVGTSTDQNPSYIYPNPGTYTVTLTVTDSLPGTNTETKIDYITVYDQVASDFSANSGIIRSYPNPAVDPPVAYPLSDYAETTTFQFTDATTGGLMPYAWAWEFGDGWASTEQNPSHAYPNAGDYTVALMVTDSLLDTDTQTKVDYLTVRLAGDANANFVIDMADVTKVERIILRMDPPTIWADANQDGEINMGDVTTIEWIILT